MTLTVRKIISSLLMVALLTAQLLMAQHMALHFDGDAHPARVAVQAAQTPTPALHAQQKDDDNCAVCFFVKFILFAMAVTLIFLLLPRFFDTRCFFTPQRCVLRIFFAAYEACGPPDFPA